MQTSNPTTKISVISAIVSGALNSDLSFDSVSDRLGLSFLDLIEGDTRRSDELLSKLLGWVGASPRGQVTTALIGARAPLSMLGVVGRSASHAGTLREALQIFCRYRALLSSNLDLRLEQGPELTALAMEHPFGCVRPTSMAEIPAGVFVRYVHDILGLRQAIVRVEFSHPRASPREIYDEIYGVPVRFEARKNAVLFRTTALTLRPARANERRVEEFTRRLEFEFQELDTRDRDMLERVCGQIFRNAQKGEFGAKVLARQLGMSLRQLQRAVRRHGCGLRTLLDEARHARALRLLQDERLSMAQVADQLGYRSQSAFGRAYKRWEGHGPSQHRLERSPLQAGLSSIEVCASPHPAQAIHECAPRDASAAACMSCVDIGSARDRRSTNSQALGSRAMAGSRDSKRPISCHAIAARKIPK